MRKTVRNGGVSLSTQSFGPTGGIPLLLVSGAMAPACFWPDGFCESLAARGVFPIRFDNRDFGQSTHFPPCRPDSGRQPPYTLEDMVLDCVAIMDEYGLEGCHVAGHSLGGSIVQLLSVLRPERVLTAAAMSSPILATGCPGLLPPDPDVEKATWEILLANPMHQDVEQGIPAFMDVWRYLNGDLPLDEEMAGAYTRKIYETETIEPAWNHTAVQTDVPDLFPALKELDIPLLFLHGSADRLVQNAANAAILADRLERASCHILQGAGHVFFNRKAWQEIETVLTRFITDAGPSMRS